MPMQAAELLRFADAVKRAWPVGKKNLYCCNLPGEL